MLPTRNYKEPNFLKYAYNASKAEYMNSRKEKKEGMNSPAIRKQVSRHFSILKKVMEEKNMSRFNWKTKQGILIKLKEI